MISATVLRKCSRSCGASAEAWQQITAAAPRFAQYEVKTDRELPIIRLVPRSGTSTA